MEKNILKDAVIRTLAFHASWEYAPTYIQLFLSLDYGKDYNSSQVNSHEIHSILQELLQDQTISCSNGRYSLNNYRHQIPLGKDKEIYYPRKLRKAKRVVWYLKKLPWIKTVCICNTTALGQSRDSGDLDFFIITKPRSIWTARFFSALPFILLKMRPENPSAQDPVCLSFFITEDAFDLSNLMLDDDPYFRYWFLFLLPLYDENVLSDLWLANSSITGRHVNAIPWISIQNHPTGQNQHISNKDDEALPFFESLFKKIQQKRLPANIKNMANQATDVVISDNVLKFHTTDARRRIRETYYKICHDFNVQP